MTLELIDAACRTLGIDPLAQGLQILDAKHLAGQHFPPLDPNVPALVAGCETRELAEQCRERLLLLYPGEHQVTGIDRAGKKGIKRLGDSKGGSGFGAGALLYVPPLAHPASFNALADVTAHLRAPEGCPWDREQTHESLRPYLLEECYEVLETLDQGDAPHLREELGDLMSLILLQIQIAYEAGEFSLSDVMAEITAKLVRRHPHVFGDTQINGMDELLANWEKIKGKEKGKSKKAKVEIPRGLPALMRAQKVAELERRGGEAGKLRGRGGKGETRRRGEAGKVREGEVEGRRGGERETRRGGEAGKLRGESRRGEEVKRLGDRESERLGEGAIRALVERLLRLKKKEKALGEALFSLAAYAEANGIDAESALRAATKG